MRLGWHLAPVKSRTVLIHGCLLAATAIVIVPLLWALKASFSANDEILGTARLLPTSLHPENYAEGLGSGPFDRYFFNSAFVAIAVTVTTVLTSAVAGYGFAKFSFPGKTILFGLVVASIMIPIQAIMIPLFVEVRALGWVDSFAGLIIPGAVSGFGIFLMRQFIGGIPDEIIDAARIDGAGELGVFVRIVLPLTRSGLAALAVLTFLASWNNFLWPLIIVQSTDMTTVPLGLMQFQGSNFTNYAQIMAVSMVACAPVVVLYVIMQRQILASFARSGISG